MLLKILDRLEEILITSLMGAATVITFVAVVHRFLVDVPLLYPYLFGINLARTHIGRAWVAIRDRDIAAAASGIDVTRYKLLAFMCSAPWNLPGATGRFSMVQSFVQAISL